MAEQIDTLRTGCAALFAAMVTACGAAGDRPSESAPDQTPVGSETSDILISGAETEDTEDGSATSERIAPEDLLRPANFYQLEWDDTAALCTIALDALNKPYGLPLSLRTLPDGTQLDYASEQAMRFLGSNSNVPWDRVSNNAVTPGSVEKASFDYFNDGVERQIVRTNGQLAGNRVVGLAVEERGSIAPLGFGHAGAVFDNLPDQDNLHTKLTYSVADVIRLGGNHYTLLMPLKDFDSSGRVYLATWRPKADTSVPRSSADYYSQLACVFRSVDPSFLDPVRD